MMLFCLGSLGLGQGSGDVDHGQQREHVGLYKAGEKIKVTAEHCGNTVGQNGYAGENSGGLQQAEETQNSAENAENHGGQLAET